MNGDYSVRAVYCGLLCSNANDSEHERSSSLPPATIYNSLRCQVVVVRAAQHNIFHDFE